MIDEAHEERKAALIHKADQWEREALELLELRKVDMADLMRIHEGSIVCTYDQKKALGRRAMGYVTRAARLREKAKSARVSSGNVHTRTISASDPHAPELLLRRYQGIRLSQSVMSRVNRTWRKWGSPDPCESTAKWEGFRRELYMTDEELAAMRDWMQKANMANRRRTQPYCQRELKKLHALLWRTQKERESVTARRESAPAEHHFPSVGIKIWTVPENMQIWISFEHEISDYLREKLCKSQWKFNFNGTWWTLLTEHNMAGALKFVKWVAGKVA